MQWAPAPADGLPDLIVFDGDCVLCSHWARWVHARDPERRFAFVAIQSEAGRALAERFGVSAENPETNIVVVAGVAHFKFDAALAVVNNLPRKSWIALFALTPRSLRNWLYDRIARNRYRWFGRREACWAPDPELRARLLERRDELRAT
jgi:predicted DCC family thiol-disulfide oxidoreductase YuxK